MKKIIYCMIMAFVIASATIAVAGISVYLIKNTSTALASQQQSNKNVTLTVFFNLFNPPKGGKPLLDNALNKLRSNHPNLNINVRYIEIDYTLHQTMPNFTRDQMLKALSNGTSVDVVTLDQIWLGEFVQKGLL